MSGISKTETNGKPAKRGRPPGQPKTGGRPPGGLNKRTVAVKDALIAAFDGLGGVPKLIEWGEENPGEFFALWVKLLPREIEVGGNLSNPIEVNVTVTLERLNELRGSFIKSAGRLSGNSVSTNGTGKPFHPGDD